MKFGDIVYYKYQKSGVWRKKKAVFLKQEEDIVYIVCEGDITATKTVMKLIKEAKIK